MFQRRQAAGERVALQQRISAAQLAQIQAAVGAVHARTTCSITRSGWWPTPAPRRSLPGAFAARRTGAAGAAPAPGRSCKTAATWYPEDLQMVLPPSPHTAWCPAATTRRRHGTGRVDAAQCRCDPELTG